MKSQQLPHHKAGGFKDENETNWPVVITILAVMTAFFITFYFVF